MGEKIILTVPHARVADQMTMGNGCNINPNKTVTFRDEQNEFKYRYLCEMEKAGYVQHKTTDRKFGVHQTDWWLTETGLAWINEVRTFSRKYFILTGRKQDVVNFRGNIENLLENCRGGKTIPVIEEILEEIRPIYKEQIEGIIRRKEKELSDGMAEEEKKIRREIETDEQTDESGELGSADGEDRPGTDGTIGGE